MRAMAPDTARTARQRKADTLAKLAQRGADAWVATASAKGDAHLVPLSLTWDGDRVILATEAGSITGQNLKRARRARLALGPERDVVMIDAIVVSMIDAGRVPQAIGDAYADQADWDPRQASEGHVFVVLVPERIQAWREANEIEGRTLMRHGKWLV